MTRVHDSGSVSYKPLTSTEQDALQGELGKARELTELTGNKTQATLGNIVPWLDESRDLSSTEKRRFEQLTGSVDPKAVEIVKNQSRMKELEEALGVLECGTPGTEAHDDAMETVGFDNGGSFLTRPIAVAKAKTELAALKAETKTLRMELARSLAGTAPNEDKTTGPSDEFRNGRDRSIPGENSARDRRPIVAGDTLYAVAETELRDAGLLKGLSPEKREERIWDSVDCIFEKNKKAGNGAVGESRDVIYAGKQLIIPDLTSRYAPEPPLSQDELRFRRHNIPV